MKQIKNFTQEMRKKKEKETGLCASKRWLRHGPTCSCLVSVIYFHSICKTVYMDHSNYTFEHNRKITVFTIFFFVLIILIFILFYTHNFSGGLYNFKYLIVERCFWYTLSCVFPQAPSVKKPLGMPILLPFNPSILKNRPYPPLGMYLDAAPVASASSSSNPTMTSNTWAASDTVRHIGLHFV